MGKRFRKLNFLNLIIVTLFLSFVKQIFRKNPKFLYVLAILKISALNAEKTILYGILLNK